MTTHGGGGESAFVQTLGREEVCLSIVEAREGEFV